MKKLLTTRSSRKLLGGLHYTVNHNGKMQGMESLSTSCTVNELCKKRHTEGNSICAHCFSFRMSSLWKTLNGPLIENTRILTSSILDKSVLPTISVRQFRFESFGDLNNWIQVANYFNLCRVNPEVRFALWTKNPWFIEEAIKNGYKKPRNLQIVLSSALINVETSPRYDFVDKVFTVFDKEYIKQNDVDINCGARSCVKCGLCYRRNPRGMKTVFVREKLK